MAVAGLTLLLASSTCGFALDPALDVSQYAHTAWRIREGFSRGSIFAIAQTPDGYLWLGTEFGLVRFDGVQAIPWQPPDGEQLPDSFVHLLLVARDGTLWIGTEKGLASWKDGQLKQYAEAAGNAVHSLAQEAEGTIWFGISNPDRLCAIRVGKMQCYGDGSFGGSVSALYEDHKGNLWVSAPTVLWRWTPGTPERYTLPGEAMRAHALVEDKNGVLLMASGKSGPYAAAVNASTEGLKQLVDGKIQSYPLPVIGGQFKPTHMLRSSDGSLWVGTLHGLLHVYEGKIDRFSANDGLSGDIVTCIFEDREGDVWVSTETGLDRFRDFAVPTISVKQGLSNGAIGVLEGTPDGSIWISTAEELNRWQNGHVTVYGKRSESGRNGQKGERDPILSVRITEIANSAFGRALSLGHDDRGQAWLGSLEGVFYFDRSHFVRVPGLPGGNILSIAGDEQGKVWISNDQEGLFYSAQHGPVQRIPWSRIGHKHAAEALLPDRLHGGVWLGFADGGIIYLKDGQVRASYNVADGLGYGGVTDLQAGSDDSVLAGTEGGLSRVKDGRVTTLSSRNGLPCDAVQWVIEDDDHSLWLYMPCDLVRISLSELNAWVRDSKRSVRTTLFASSDGVWSRGRPGHFSRNVAKSSDGKIWFAPPDGVSVIDPRHLPFNKLPPPVYVKQIAANGRKFVASQGLRLPARVRDLEIDYTALSLVEPEKNQFKYKLEGYDRDWQEAGNRRQVFYTNLPPRSYRFRVIASNNRGLWNETGDTIEFSIAPAYYQANWFRASLVAAFFLGLWALYRFRLRQIAREYGSHLEGRVAERVRVARELHDTLLQTVQGLMLRLQVVAEMLPPGEAKDELEQTMEVGDQAIVEGRKTVHDLRFPTTQELAQAVRTMGDELANGGNVSFRLVVEGPTGRLHPIVRDELYRIAAEALRNAFAHARAKHIEAQITFGDKLLQLRIRDDGQGVSREILKEGRPGHFGLAGMRERASQIGAKLTIWSAIGAGTEIDVMIPGTIAYGKPTGSSRFTFLRRKTGVN